MREFVIPEKQGITAGIINLANWMMMADGQLYNAAWCQRWEILADKQIPVDGFRSSEHWQLIGIANGEIAILIPGCQVYTWVFCEQPPQNNNCYSFGR